MKGHLIGSIEVRDPGVFEVYRQKVGAVIAAYGGRYMVRGGAVTTVEGHLPVARLVVLEFPSMADVRRFYDSPEYAPLLKLRLDSTKSDVAFVEGYAGHSV